MTNGSGEWCFGSFDGAYDGDLFMGVLPRVFKVDDLPVEPDGASRRDRRSGYHWMG